MIHPLDIDMLENVARKLDGIQQIVAALEVFSADSALDSPAMNVLRDMIFHVMDDQNTVVKRLSAKVTIKPTVAGTLKKAG